MGRRTRTRWSTGWSSSASTSCSSSAGDGSMRGAAGIAAVLREREIAIGVVGIPKTIDNDIPFIGQSFGFVTAFSVAARSINAAMVEAQVGHRRRRPGEADGTALRVHRLLRRAGQPRGRLRPHPGGARSRSRGSTVCWPACVDGSRDRGSAVVVVAEGAGQDVLAAAGSASAGTDASGNTGSVDIGAVPQGRASATHFASRGSAADAEVRRPRVRDPLRPGRAARRRLLRQARPGRRARGHGRADGHGGGTTPQPLHPRARSRWWSPSATRSLPTVTCG